MPAFTSRAAIWFILAALFIILGLGKRRSRAFIGAGIAFAAVGILQARKGQQPPRP